MTEFDLEAALMEVEEAERALDDFLWGGEYDPDKHRRLARIIDLRRKELLDKLAAIYPCSRGVRN